jgi:hypothetical protein
MDYVEHKLASEFIFNNPNIKGTCGCGESFNVWHRLDFIMSPLWGQIIVF